MAKSWNLGIFQPPNFLDTHRRGHVDMSGRIGIEAFAGPQGRWGAFPSIPGAWAVLYFSGFFQGQQFYDSDNMLQKIKLVGS